MNSQLLLSQKIDKLLSFVQSLPTSGASSQQQQQPQNDQSDNKYDDYNDNKFYLTTAINYTNGRPHIGHAYEAVTSDIICRYHRIYGRDVFFLTGTDEHGQKVANTAADKGVTPKELCDENVAIFQELNRQLRISNDYYIRTTDPDHYKLAAQMFSLAHKNGDIYFSKYEGWYDIREERFLTETQAKVTNYLDPVTGKKYAKQAEESYFFRMSKYQDRLLKHLEDNPTWIQPEKSYQLIYNRLCGDNKLEDLCVSRSTFDWGIPVPINDKHIIYVWFDALSNYLTGIKYFDANDDKNLKRFWPVNVHVIGKDIAWFHCVIWPCILMSCNISLPGSVYCHGFVTDKNGEKMSKSVGNVIDPLKELKKYDADTLRYFIATQANFGNDLRWNTRDLEERHDAHLTHIYGNLVNRALKLCKKNNRGLIPDVAPYIDIFDLNLLICDTENSYKSFDLLLSAELAMNALRECNDWITKKEPWKLKGDANKNEKLRIIRSILECIYILSHFMEPFTPRASQRVFNDLNHNKKTILLLKNSNFNNLCANRKIKSSGLLFKPLTLTKFEKKKINENKPIIAHIDFKIGRIKEIKIHPQNDRLYVSTIDIGENKPRIICSGLVKHYPDSLDLLNKKVIVFSNLKYTKFKGIESQGMVMCASSNDKSSVKILSPSDNSKIGERITWKKIDLNQWDPDDKINIKKKNSFWTKQVVDKLFTDNDGDMAFNEIKFCTKDGKPITSPLKNAQIS